ncbi:putative Tetratricopeptide repeat protein 14 [Hypsibius exemplaris]|uniref:Tetratricopeptide repeat protein 14 n=1 Tax=Hypsibius exemplaris TaxID=2072580 RepID=A0A9X6NDQ3_HYPEX|nr:putative Tetratricopeptide repeat protein 14 [Hypsibius exemplaris]
MSLEDGDGKKLSACSTPCGLGICMFADREKKSRVWPCRLALGNSIGKHISGGGISGRCGLPKNAVFVKIRIFKITLKVMVYQRRILARISRILALPRKSLWYISSNCKEKKTFSPMPLYGGRERLDELSERKADVLRILSKWSAEQQGEEPGRRSCVKNEEFCPVAPPLEDFLRLPSDASRSIRTRRFFEDVRKGDLLYGVVSSKSMSGLNVQLLAGEWSVMARSLDDLGIKGSESAQAARRNKFVLSVLPALEKMTLSLSQLDAVSGTAGEAALSLGLVAREELPKYYRQISHDPAEKSSDLAAYVRRQREFSNPAFLEMMRTQLEVPTSATTKRWHSLLPGYCGKQVRPEDSPDELTTIQSARWSMKSVEEGIKLMKEDNIPGALRELNKAVEMSKANVEALVARGALYARKEDFHRAIRDFEEALKLNRNHRNARKYLSDTFYHLGKKFEADEPERALKFFKDALHLDPKFEEALEGQRRLSKQHQSGHSASKPTTKEPEKSSISTAEKLRQMLLQPTSSNGKSNSKRGRRSPSPTRSPSSPRDTGRKRDRRRRSSTPKRDVKIVSSANGAEQKQREDPDVQIISSRSRERSCERSRRSAMGLPKQPAARRPSPAVHVDVDDVEAQLEAFRSAKKAQLLATNKDIHKRTFL